MLGLEGNYLRRQYSTRGRITKNEGDNIELVILTLAYFEWKRFFDYSCDERTHLLVISESVQAVSVWYKSYSVRGYGLIISSQGLPETSVTPTCSITLYSDYMNKDVQ